jgi:hypothetical protein
MDEKLERLAREAATDPTDEAAARRLDSALARAGREEELRERYRFKFECPLRWQDLSVSESGRTRYCHECKQRVFAVQDLAELREHVRKGHCVGVPSSLLALAFSELPKERSLHSATDPEAPCVVPGGALPLPQTIPEGVQRLLRREEAERLRAVPIAIRDGTTVLATAKQTPRQARIVAVRFRRVETVLVAEDELAALIAAIPDFPEEDGPHVRVGRVAPFPRP